MKIKIILRSFLIYYATTVLFMITSISKHNMTIYQLNKKWWKTSLLIPLITIEGLASVFDPHHFGFKRWQFLHLPLARFSPGSHCSVWHHPGLHPSSSGLMGTLSRTPMPVFIAHLSRNATSAALQKQQVLFLGARKKGGHDIIWFGILPNGFIHINEPWIKERLKFV